MFEKMENDNIAHESLKSFVTMEDNFLNLERVSVCSGISQKVEAFALSDEIKNTLKKIKKKIIEKTISIL